jgi:hypothetical protein
MHHSAIAFWRCWEGDSALRDLSVRFLGVGVRSLFGDVGVRSLFGGCGGAIALGVWQGRSLFGDVGDRVNRARQLLRAIVPVIRGIVGKAIVFWDVEVDRFPVLIC